METDEELMQQYVETGCNRAFEELRSRCIHQIKDRLTRRFGIRWQDAVDIGQEAFLQVVRNRGVYDPSKGAFAAWLWTIARNRAVDFLRKESKHKHAELIEPAAPSEPESLHLEDLDDDMKLFVRRIQAGETAKETAKDIGVPRTTYMRHEKRTIERMRRLFEMGD